MLICGCGYLMHTEGIDEQVGEQRAVTWLVRLECRQCRLHIGALTSPDKALEVVDRLMWTDDAKHVLERMPPYVSPLVRQQAEEFARARGQRVITFWLLAQARNGATIVWDAEAECRLEKIPAPVRAMARIELERTALDKGSSHVTVALMEEVKARYFGMFSSKQ